VTRHDPPTDFPSLGTVTCHDTEQSPNLTINHLPDEVLLEIFDSYRQGIGHYDRRWKKKYVWFNLTHVCRKWRAVMFASSSRLDLGITVGPKKPGHIKTILSGHLPILINYNRMHREITGSALWRMRAALKQHRDRVREINFGGTRANFDKFFELTNCPFPVLESLVLRLENHYDAKFPDTFLRGADPSDLHLRRLSLNDFHLTSISGFLLSATDLTDLSLLIDTAFGPSPETSLLTCLQGMLCLRRLDLSMSSRPLKSTSQPPTLRNIVPLSKLTRLRYDGHSVFLDALVAGLSAPSLRDVNIKFLGKILPPIVHLPRFINEIEEHYHAVHMTFRERDFRLLLLTQSEYITHCKPRFTLGSVLRHSSKSIILLSGLLSARLTAVEELRLTFDQKKAAEIWDKSIKWRRFLQQFPSVKALRTEGANSHYIARILLHGREEPGDDLAFLPALEEIEIGKDPLFTSERQTRSQLAAFRPFISARQRAVRPVNVSLIPSAHTYPPW
jgi:hypothetical protein